MKTSLEASDLMKIPKISTKELAESILGVLDPEEREQVLSWINALDVLKDLYENELDKEYADYHLKNAIHYLEELIVSATLYHPNYTM